MGNTKSKTYEPEQCHVKECTEDAIQRVDEIPHGGKCDLCRPSYNSGRACPKHKNGYVYICPNMPTIFSYYYYYDMNPMHIRGYVNIIENRPRTGFFKIRNDYIWFTPRCIIRFRYCNSNVYRHTQSGGTDILEDLTVEFTLRNQDRSTYFGIIPRDIIGIIGRCSWYHGQLNLSYINM